MPGGDRNHPCANVCGIARKPWGIVSRGPEYATRMQSWRCQLIVLGADVHVAHAGIRSIKERYASFFPRA